MRRAEVWPDVGVWKITVHRCSTAVSGTGSLVPTDVVVTGASVESVEHDSRPPMRRRPLQAAQRHDLSQVECPTSHPHEVLEMCRSSRSRVGAADGSALRTSSTEGFFALASYADDPPIALASGRCILFRCLGTGEMRRWG